MQHATILLAEDEQHTRNTLALVLENAGYLVLETQSGTDALHMILSRLHTDSPIDLLILDIELNGLSGWEVLDNLQKQHALVPTIVITGLTEHYSFKNSQYSMLCEFLPKPFSPDTLTVIVKTLLPQKERS